MNTCSAWPNGVDFGGEVLMHVLFLTVSFLGYRQRRLQTVWLVEVLGRDGQGRVARGGRCESRGGCRKGEGSGGWADA